MAVQFRRLSRRTAWMNGPSRTGKSEQESSVNKSIRPLSSKARFRRITSKRMKFGQRGGRWLPGWPWPSMPAVVYGWQESSVFVEIENWQMAYCDAFAHAVTACEAYWSVLTDGRPTPRALCVRFATK